MILKNIDKLLLCLIFTTGLIACSLSPVTPTLITKAIDVASDEINLFPPAASSPATEDTDRLAMSLLPVESPDFTVKPIPVVNAWDRVVSNFQLDINVNNKRTRVQRNWYASHQDYFERISKRADRYLFHVISELEKRNMPGELALLPIVESAFDPFAFSHGRASGMWQFIPGTGKRYGLKQDWWYDGRRDVVASTTAALDYLQALHKRFDGNWFYALAAYNAGGGNVRKAIRQNKKLGRPVDFWSLNLPKETKAYVPKLIALAQLLKNPEQHKLTFPEIANSPYFEPVDIGSQIDLAQAAELAEISLDELYLLNPGFNQWATSPAGPHRLNVPVEQAELFKSNLTQLPKEERVSWIRYKIRNGDSLSTIAAKHHTTANILKQVNDMRSSRIRAGHVLFIPVASQSAQHYVLSSSQRLKVKQGSGAKSGKDKTVHVVQSGDSFWTISRKYKVGMREIGRWNGLGTTEKLRIGQELVIWSHIPTTTTQASGGERQIIRKIGYRVRSGDSLAKIADKFNISIAGIESWNGINRKQYLQPGQSLKLYVDVASAHL